MLLKKNVMGFPKVIEKIIALPDFVLAFAGPLSTVRIDDLTVSNELRALF